MGFHQTGHGASDQLRSGFEIDLGKKLISTAGATEYSAMALLRKRTLFGWLGDVYFVEYRIKKKNKSTPGRYALFGGTIEQSNDEKDLTPKVALARELNEEIGEPPSGKFKDGHFDFVASLLGGAEVDGSIATDIYRLKDTQANELNFARIVNYQKARKDEYEEKTKELAALESKPAGSRDEGKIQELKNDIARLTHIISAGRPFKVRNFHGVWIAIDWTRVTPDWKKFSPVAAYALIADGRQRKNKIRS